MAAELKKKSEKHSLENLVPKPMESKYIDPEKTIRGKIIPKKKKE